jgi:hypothetical protein
MPFGRKPDEHGRMVDFDAVYAALIAPAIQAADMEPIRADQEEVGGAIHKPMFERLILCEYAIADVTGANPNVYYELGIRHAVRPRSTIVLFAEGQSLPFDIALLRGLPYALTDKGAPSDASKVGAVITQRLQAARRDGADDSPLFQLVEGMPRADIDHSRTDVFREQVEYSAACKRALADARRTGKAAVQAFAETPAMADLRDVEAGVIVDLMLSFRAVEAWDDMTALYARMPAPLQRTRLVREQYAFALNRCGRRGEAETVLRAVIGEYGPSSETNALLGRVYKDQWTQAQGANDLAARGYLRKAVAAYLEGFEADWRDAYPGVNAVTLMEMQEPVDPRQAEILPVVRYAAQRRASRGGDYWDFATLMELAVIARDGAAALDHAESALAFPVESWQPKSTADNIAKIAALRESRGEDAGWIRALEGHLRRAGD